jgi:hypothetical protein
LAITRVMFPYQSIQVCYWSAGIVAARQHLEL